MEPQSFEDIINVIYYYYQMEAVYKENEVKFINNNKEYIKKLKEKS